MMPDGVVPAPVMAIEVERFRQGHPAQSSYLGLFPALKTDLRPEVLE
jgi:hypothetical protein